jgi:plasmid replication initiation protein
MCSCVCEADKQVRWFFRLSPDQYEEPKHIAAAVLKRSMRELNERADVTFRYDPIKEGKKNRRMAFPSDTEYPNYHTASRRSCGKATPGAPRGRAMY